MNEQIIEDQTDNILKTLDGSNEKVLLVNIFTPKGGQLDSFVEAQLAEYRRLNINGWIGNKLSVSVDKKTVVNIALFENIELYNQWRESEMFKHHVDQISPFLTSSKPGMYKTIYSAGEI